VLHFNVCVNVNKICLKDSCISTFVSLIATTHKITNVFIIEMS